MVSILLENLRPTSHKRISRSRQIKVQITHLLYFINLLQGTAMQKGSKTFVQGNNYKNTNTAISKRVDVKFSTV